MAVDIVEFGDYSCPSCARAFDVLQRLEKEFGSRVKVDFKNLPLTHLHPDAMVAAEAAEAARAQGRFEEMQKALFENHEKLDADRVLQIARSVGLDMKRFAEDMTRGAGLERIKHDMEEAKSLGVRGTPCLFVDGRHFEGELTVEAIRGLLN
jgi:predicted DsbA family dithiol-disulfide isomerase